MGLLNSRQIYGKLNNVIKENKELEKMVSAGRVEQLGIEIAMLRRENELCKERIEGLFLHRNTG